MIPTGMFIVCGFRVRWNAICRLYGWALSLWRLRWVRLRILHQDGWLIIFGYVYPWQGQGTDNRHLCLQKRFVLRIFNPFWSLAIHSWLTLRSIWLGSEPLAYSNCCRFNSILSYSLLGQLNSVFSVFMPVYSICNSHCLWLSCSIVEWKGQSGQLAFPCLLVLEVFWCKCFL